MSCLAVNPCRDSNDRVNERGSSSFTGDYLTV